MNDRDKRFSAYIEVLEAIGESAGAGIEASKQNEARTKYIVAKQKVIFYGSKNVVQALSNISNFNARDKKQYHDYLELILLMRRETFLSPYKKNLPYDLLEKLLGSSQSKIQYKSDR